MSRYYLDTSALVKLYVREVGTDAMLRLANAVPENQFVILSLAAVELRSAVRRRERSGDVTGGDAQSVLEQFSGHLTSLLVRQPVTERTIEIANRIVDRHNLRAYDALQLAGCLGAAESSKGREPTFVCSDDTLLSAADREGLTTVNPATE